MAIVACAGPVDRQALLAGSAYLESIGLKVRHGANLFKRKGYLASTDRQRIQDLRCAIADDEVKGILFARGGYGVMRLLESVDAESAARSRKLMLGMSDITALSLSLYARCGLVTLAGPMVAGQVADGLDPLSESSLHAALFSSLSSVELVPEGMPIDVIRHGIAAGPLLGGCLSLVTALLGSRHSPDYGNSILLLEDVNEPLYRIDRMLVQLKLAGILDRVGGIVLGHFVFEHERGLAGRVARLVEDLTRGRQVPVISGFPHGHALPNVTVPLGIEAKMRTDPPSLIVA